MAGYQHVIATLWQVSDLTAVDIPRHLYDQIIIERYGIIQIDAYSAASALRKAVLAVRDGSGLPALSTGHRTSTPDRDCHIVAASTTPLKLPSDTGVRRNRGAWHAEGQGFGGCPRGLCSVSAILPALTSPLHRSINLPELAGSARLLRWEQDGNTRAVHERSRPVPADPARSRMILANDSAEQANCTVVLADAGLEGHASATAGHR